MVTVREVPADKVVPALAQELKKIDTIKPHKAAAFVKSGVDAERPPEQPDFWYLRSAAVLRKIYLRGPVGTQRLRTAFGGKRRRGTKPAKHRKAGGKFIRLMLQQLEKSGLVAKREKAPHGRAITAKGQKLVDKVAAKVGK
ncbi:MAG: 30S ribosomal protein S19e [Candidatus Aenigmatarchaeota archaeon]